MKKPKYITKLAGVPELSDNERDALAPVAERFVFRTNDYYNSLIDWDDPDDPIRKLVIPSKDELSDWGRLDASYEEAYTVAPGVEHKYPDTALLLCNDVCGAYCRFCFRKRLFMDANDEVVRDVAPGLAYIAEHTEISNVLLTGGDPLLMSTHRLEKIIEPLREIEHVKIIRIGSKLPAFNPYRILNDESLIELLGRHSTNERKIYVMAHFNHPVELTEPAIEALNLLQAAGVTTVNQTPIIRGINDNVGVLTELFAQLSYIGVPPYYVFQCRPTEGNEPFSLPVERAYEVFEQARLANSGLAARARLVMSHATGKVEICGLTDEHIVFKYHRAHRPEHRGRVVVAKRIEGAAWFDDYPEAAAFAGPAESAPHAASTPPQVASTPHIEATPQADSTPHTEGLSQAEAASIVAPRPVPAAARPYAVANPAGPVRARSTHAGSGAPSGTSHGPQPAHAAAAHIGTRAQAATAATSDSVAPARVPSRAPRGPKSRDYVGTPSE